MKTIHPALPQTFTPEQLAVWLTDNKAEQINHSEKTPLDEDKVRELEHKSSMASRRIDELNAVKKTFEAFLKEGTPTERIGDNELDEPKHIPQPITIPGTKGIKALQKNREWADKQLADGFSEQIISYYLIPFPEERRMIAVDIEGVENETYSRDMTDFETDQYSKPLLEAIGDGQTLEVPFEDAPVEDAKPKSKKKDKKPDSEESFV